jgi:hypothetical protein
MTTGESLPFSLTGMLVPSLDPTGELLPFSPGSLSVEVWPSSVLDMANAAVASYNCTMLEPIPVQINRQKVGVSYEYLYKVSLFMMTFYS